jgi:hypothetical protein
MPETNAQKIVEDGAKAIAEVPAKFEGFNEGLYDSLYRTLVSEKDGEIVIEEGNVEKAINAASEYVAKHILEKILGWKNDKATHDFLQKAADNLGTKMVNLLLQHHGIKLGTIEDIVSRLAQEGPAAIMEKGFGTIKGNLTKGYFGKETGFAGAKATKAITTDTRALEAAKAIIRKSMGDKTPKELEYMAGENVAELYAAAASQLYGRN